MAAILLYSKLTKCGPQKSFFLSARFFSSDGTVEKEVDAQKRVPQHNAGSARFKPTQMLIDATDCLSAAVRSGNAELAKTMNEQVRRHLADLCGPETIKTGMWSKKTLSDDPAELKLIIREVYGELNSRNSQLILVLFFFAFSVLCYIVSAGLDRFAIFYNECSKFHSK